MRLIVNREPGFSLTYAVKCFNSRDGAIDSSRFAFINEVITVVSIPEMVRLIDSRLC